MINCRLEIVKKIGEGRSEVYLCKDTDFDGREVAVKFLPSDAGIKEQATFREEFFVLGKLDHPNIIKAFEIGEVVKIDPGDPISIGSKFILLEYFESTELFESQFVEEENNLKEILKQICSVLYYIHQSNYIYYDLKHENILVSIKSEKPDIKLIDLGLAEFLPDLNEHIIKGTAQYIAPEILKKESHDHRVDLYSLGILLYQLIYGYSPFSDNNELDIYKAQVEKDFDFPESENFSKKLIDITKKLLEKDPSKRYTNSLQVIHDLGYEIDSSIYHNFVPASVLSGGEDFINILSTYIKDKSSSEVFTLKGFDGAGKTSLLNRMYEELPNSIFISSTQGITGIELIKHLVKKMIFSSVVFTKLSDEEKSKLISFIDKSNKDYLSEVHLVIAIITGKSGFVVLIDDYNLFDSFAQNILSELIPIFQVNGSKVIVSETSDFDYASNHINNLRELVVGSFTEKQLTEYLELAFYKLFPRENLKELIVRFADLLPGNIIDFIKDLINLQIIAFGPEGASVIENLEKISGLEDSISGIYDLRLSNLSEKERTVVNIIAAFEVGLDQNIIIKLLDINQDELDNTLISLQFNNIILPISINPVPVIVSDGLKKHVYQLIDNKGEFHEQLASIIETSLPDFNKNEFARQFELAGNYEKAYFVLMQEIENAEELAAYTYIKNILTHLVNLPISKANKNNVIYKLAETLYKLSDYNTALNTTDEVNIELLSREKTLELFIIRGSSMINSGRLDEGVQVINSLLPEVVDDYRRSKLLVEIAYAKFDSNDFEEAADLCKKILNGQKVSDEDRGRLYNLLGLCFIYQNQNTQDALKEFFKSREYYEKAKLTVKVAAIEVNIGNIYNLHGDTFNAEVHWKRALELNLSIGNLDQEGVLLLNNGIYYFNKSSFDECIEYYNRAHRIFLSLGNLRNQGLALSNLGEVYLLTCEYQKAFDVLREARSIFEKAENIAELVPVYHLLGQFHFDVGNREQLSKISDQLLLLLTDSQQREKFNIEVLFLKNLRNITEGVEIDIEELESVREEYLKAEDLKNYVAVNTILLNYLINLELFPKAEEELLNPDYIRVCENNNIYNANREYLCGRFSANYNSPNTLTAVEHFEKAYELLFDESITELTWKVLYSLSVIYAERGNFDKAKNFIIYTRDLINLIAENIETTQIKTAYLQKEERRNALDKLEELYVS